MRIKLVCVVIALAVAAISCGEDLADCERCEDDGECKSNKCEDLYNGFGDFVGKFCISRDDQVCNLN